LNNVQNGTAERQGKVARTDRQPQGVVGKAPVEQPRCCIRLFQTIRPKKGQYKVVSMLGNVQNAVHKVRAIKLGTTVRNELQSTGRT